MKTLKQIFYYVASLIVFTSICLSIFSTKAYSSEDVYHQLGLTLNSKPFLTIILIILSLFAIIIWKKIIENMFGWLENHNLLTHALSKYEMFYDRGEYDKVLSVINSKSIWRHFKSYQYLIHKLVANAYLLQGKKELCFQSINHAYKYAQTAEKKNDLEKIKFQLFISAGGIISAREIFDTIKELSPKSSSQTLSHLEAILIEKQGNLEEARAKLISAAHLFENKNPKELFVIYNNLGRISGLLHNLTDKILYYEKAKSLLSSTKMKYHSHVVYQNLIDAYLALSQPNKYSPLFLEYLSLLDMTNKYDLLEFYNHSLQFNRQTNNYEEFRNTIAQMHKNLYPLLTIDEQLASDIYELRFSFNNIGVPHKLLHKIEDNFSLYEKYDLSEKLFAFHIIFQSITSPDGTMTLHPFEKMHQYIFEFFRNSLSEIDDYIKNEIHDFQVYEKCSLLEKKVFLHNYQEYVTSDIYSIIQNKLKLIDDITDCYSSSGNVIPGLESSLNYVDECMGSLRNPLNTHQFGKIKEQMSIAFEKAETTILQLLKHPEMPPHFIRISRYALFLEKKEISKQYLDRFLELKISIHHFSAYVQQYYSEVYNYFYS